MQKKRTCIRFVKRKEAGETFWGMKELAPWSVRVVCELVDKFVNVHRNKTVSMS